MRKMNKKGHVGTLLLFFGALVLVAAALFSFVSFKNDFDYRADELVILSNQIDFAQKYIEYVFEDMVDKTLANIDDNFDEDVFRANFERIAKERNLNDGVADDFYAKIERGEYEVDLEENKIVIEDVKISAEAGENEISREFGLVFEFEG